MEEKYFMWYISGNYKPFYGPYYESDIEVVGGTKLYHTLSKLLKMSISDSLKKRINNAKIGTTIKIHYYSSRGDLMLKRINEDKIKMLDKIDILNQEHERLEQKIRELDHEKKEINAKLFNSLD